MDEEVEQPDVTEEDPAAEPEAATSDELVQPSQQEWESPVIPEAEAEAGPGLPEDAGGVPSTSGEADAAAEPEQQELAATSRSAGEDSQSQGEGGASVPASVAGAPAISEQLEPVPLQQQMVMAPVYVPAQAPLQAEPSGQGDYMPQGDPLAALAAAATYDVVAQLPRYAAPSIASTLPAYRNGEQEFIHRTFAVGNYDMLRHLPATIREQQVIANRTARQEATRTFLMPGLLGTQLRHRAAPDNQQGLFTPFEYIPSKYSLAAELAAKERVAAEATRLTIGKGREFTPTIAPKMLKNEDYDAQRGYIYLAGPEEDTEDLRVSQRSHHESAHLQAPFLPAGVQKLAAEVPTRLAATAMMKRLKRTLEADWEGAVISIFENEHDCWVVCFQEAYVDSPEGLAAYMNVFVRTNPVATEFRLTKVVEFWGNVPGDGCAYYVMRPPWVAHDRLATFFTLHPEEKDYRTSFPVVEMDKARAARQKAMAAGTDELEVDSRMKQLSVRSLHSSPSTAAAGGPGSAALSARSQAPAGR